MDLTGSLPPITRLWAYSSIALSLSEHIGLLSRFSLFYSPSLAFLPPNPQPYRAITTFLYFGPLGIDFFFHLFFFVRYARMLEENHYAGHPADFAWLVLVCAIGLLLVAPVVVAGVPFLGGALAFCLVYLWSRRNKHVRLSLFGVLVITAPYLPVALCGFSWVLTGSATAVKGDLLGVGVGHVYYFFADVWPKEVGSGGRELLGTPQWL
ncbi:Der1-like protein [Jaminaea rosea]|uniref:Derlin n=1 Tax=Jaminaea rosea TaxID=1569628 RepID=A0A316UNV4_9BASI|nr:Der1-like protein [Jaminaea rosea]PWN24845.1 Der1-like protein [Jaminaea rosea]